MRTQGRSWSRSAYDDWLLLSYVSSNSSSHVSWADAVPSFASVVERTASLQVIRTLNVQINCATSQLCLSVLGVWQRSWYSSSSNRSSSGSHMGSSFGGGSFSGGGGSGGGW